MDMLTTQFLCSIAARVHPKFDFAWMIQEVWENMEFELDFLNEVRFSRIIVINCTFHVTVNI